MVGESDLVQAQLGLGHNYSRSKVKFNVNKLDDMIIQAIALLDQLDKDLNTFAMRVRCVCFGSACYCHPLLMLIGLTENGTRGTSLSWCNIALTTTSCAA